MPRPPRLALVFWLACASATPSIGQPAAPPTQPATSRFDPRLVALRRASALWMRQGGPRREVIDQVCLVPDEAAFFEALAAWDDHHVFPILIDEPELVLKFLQAFRPARVVRFSGAGKAPEGDRWARAVEAIGSSWTRVDTAADDRLKGDAVPSRLGKTPPGVVLARPTSPALPGLAALAAGRFQPLVRLDAPRDEKVTLKKEEIDPFAAALTSAVASVASDHASLGDGCDFLTLAGDYPYRYEGPKGAMAVDDRVGRDGQGRRWAFAGRIGGDAKTSVYAAMCSLFLRPGPSALLFDSYSQSNEPWKYYSLRGAANHLQPLMPTGLVVGEKRANVSGWHEAFDPANRAGLVLANSMGSPTVFHLAGTPAHAFDVMPSAPAAVAMIHSYSAADPTNPGTIAGRWLAQGAFLYAGAMDEPYLNAFRLPALFAELMATGVPLAAAYRPMHDEPFGHPWKLVVLGDPLFAIARVEGDRERTRAFPTGPGWPPYAATPPPRPDAPELTRLAWSVGAALVGTTSGAEPNPPGLLAVLRSIDRTRLERPARGAYDDLLAILLYQDRQYPALRSFVSDIPKSERTPTSQRLAISAGLVEFEAAVARRDLERASAFWSELIVLADDGEFAGILTGRLAPLADSPSLRDGWRARLRAAIGPSSSPALRQAATAELKRLDEADKARPGR